MAKSIKEQQNMYVVKSNDLIRKSQFDLSTTQQKIVLYFISKIQPNDDSSQWYETSVNEICKVCGWDNSDGSYYHRIKSIIKDLTKRDWCFLPDQKTEATFSWIGDAKMIRNSEKISFCFNANVQPYLFEVKEKYTQYKLNNILLFKNKYAIRLYEILRSYTTQRAIDNYHTKEVVIDIVLLRNLLQITSYELWNDLNRKVIRKAVDEINKSVDDIFIEYMPVKSDAVYDKVVFRIKSANSKQMYDVAQKRKKLSIEKKL